MFKSFSGTRIAGSDIAGIYVLRPSKAADGLPISLTLVDADEDVIPFNFNFVH